MPENMKFKPQRELLSIDEMIRITSILGRLGISKIRLTGGEPFMRKGIDRLLDHFAASEYIRECSVTTNGTLGDQLLNKLENWNIATVNLSLDSLDRERFHQITRRDMHAEVLRTLDELLRRPVMVKVNCVVMPGQNTQDILPLAELTRSKRVCVRYIEEMPFSGGGRDHPTLEWNHTRILAELKAGFPNLERIEDPAHSTAEHYRIPGAEGSLGIIPAFSRTFCGSCNRIRMTATGTLKTCLYDHGVLDIKAKMRAGASDKELSAHFLAAFSNRAQDGFEAERRTSSTRPALVKKLAPVGKKPSGSFEPLPSLPESIPPSPFDDEGPSRESMSTIGG